MRKLAEPLGDLGVIGKFLETICIRDGVPQHPEWHQRRVDATMQHFFPAHHHSWNLEKCIDVPSDLQNQLIRCRIKYDAHHISIHYYPYSPRVIKNLKLAEAPPEYDYRYKYADRNLIEELYNQKGEADDILITKDGWITDTSVGNIAFQKNGRWYTPSIPLLAGTTWKRLVHEGVLIPRPIHATEIRSFKNFRVFNALNSFDNTAEFPVGNIK